MERDSTLLISWHVQVRFERGTVATPELLQDIELPSSISVLGQPVDLTNLKARPLSALQIQAPSCDIALCLHHTGRHLHFMIVHSEHQAAQRGPDMIAITALEGYPWMSFGLDRASRDTTIVLQLWTGQACMGLVA